MLKKPEITYDKLKAKKFNKRALFITGYEGYGDLVYHTPIIRVLSQIYTHLDVLCKRIEPFLNSPHIKNLKIFDQLSPDLFTSYEQCVFPVTVHEIPSLAFHHNHMHTVDLVSIKALRCTLRDTEKTLEAYWTIEDKQSVLQLVTEHPLAKKNKIKENQFVVISPAITWPSRTLPLSFYQKLITGIQKEGYGVVLVGKDISYESGIDIDKTMYPSHYFPNTICLYNQLSFAQLCALYSFTPIAINTENGNNPISCTNDYCWNIYIPTLTAPEFRLPHRHGSQQYRTAVVANAENYYPASIYGDIGTISHLNMPVLLPTVENVLLVFKSILLKIKEGKNTLI